MLVLVKGSLRKLESQVRAGKTRQRMTKLQEVLVGSRYRARGRFRYRVLPGGEDRALPGCEDGIVFEAARKER